MKINFKAEKGQSLFEVILALGIASLVVTALVRVTTTSVHNASFSRNQSQATKYAQEGMEKVRAYKNEEIWSTFINDCEDLAKLGIVDPPPPFSTLLDCYDSTNHLAACNAANPCEVEVKVVWGDSQGEHNSKLIARFTTW